jgi:hypothetical protein
LPNIDLTCLTFHAQKLLLSDVIRKVTKTLGLVPLHITIVREMMKKKIDFVKIKFHLKEFI